MRIFYQKQTTMLVKQLGLLLFVVLLLAIKADSQNGRSPFRRGYFRVGIQTTNEKLDNNLSVKDNILKGNFGAGTGFTLESGHIYYFIPPKKAKLIDAGIDWTIFSIAFNSSEKKWNAYEAANNYSDIDFIGKMLVSFSTRIGPVISFNPVENLIIDVRAQVSAGVYIIGPMYESSEEPISFYTYRDKDNATGLKKFSQYASNTGIKPNLGISVRRKWLGIAMDYSPGKVNVFYTAKDNNVTATGVKKVPMNTFQLKLSFSR